MLFAWVPLLYVAYDPAGASLMKTANLANTVLLAVGGLILLGLLATRPAPAPTAEQLKAAAVAIQHSKSNPEAQQ